MYKGYHPSIATTVRHFRQQASRQHDACRWQDRPTVPGYWQEGTSVHVSQICHSSTSLPLFTPIEALIYGFIRDHFSESSLTSITVITHHTMQNEIDPGDFGFDATASPAPAPAPAQPDPDLDNSTRSRKRQRPLPSSTAQATPQPDPEVGSSSRSDDVSCYWSLLL